MKKKITFFAFGIVILSVAFIIGLKFFPISRQIVDDVNTSHIERIQYNANGSGELIDVYNYDEAKILNYLNTCKERRTLLTSGRYLLIDVTIEIVIRTDAGLKHVLLGDINYSSYGTGTAKYEILNSKEVTATLLEILNLY